MTATHANLLAERAVVGAALHGHAAGLLSLDPAVDLTDVRLQAVAAAILSLGSNESLSPVAVLTQMQSLPDFPWARSSEVGVFLAELAGIDTCPVPAQSSWHAISVRAATARRRLMAAGQRLQDWAADEIDPQAVADRIALELMDLTAAVQRISPQAVSA